MAGAPMQSDAETDLTPISRVNNVAYCLRRVLLYIANQLPGYYATMSKTPYWAEFGNPAPRAYRSTSTLTENI